MTPTLGRIVHYQLTKMDAEAINRRREDALNSDFAAQRTGGIMHIGNEASGGETYPAIVTSAINGRLVNLQVFLDGNDHYWVQAVGEGDKPGEWQWPPRV